MSAYQKALEDTIHKYKTGLVDLETYSKRMQNIIFGNASTYKGDFTKLSDRSQERYVNELNKAYQLQGMALDEVYKTTKKIQSEDDKRLKAINDQSIAIQKMRVAFENANLKYDTGVNQDKSNGIQAQIDALARLNPQSAEYARILKETQMAVGLYNKELITTTTSENKQSKAIVDKTIAISKLKDKLNSMNTNYGSYVDSGKSSEITRMIGDLEKLSPLSVEYNNKLKTIQYETSKLGSQSKQSFKLAQDAISDTTSKTTAMGLALRQVMAVFAVGSPIFMARNVFMDMTTSINEMNKAMTDIRIVTDMSAESANGLSQTYNQLAIQMGATTMDVLQGSTEWFRQGKTIAETQELVKSSIIGSKLAGIEAADMTQYLTSALNGYKMEASSAISVIDKLVAVDNAAATSVSELAIAMSHTASSARMVGVDMDDLIGYIGTVSSVTRKSAESIGNSFKTIFSRFQNLKLGNFIEDGMVMSDVRKALGNVKIDIMETEDTFRDFGVVLDELSGKWDTLSDAEKSSVAGAMAGIRQREDFIVLLDNISMSADLTTKSIESQGLSMERYDIYLQSTEAALNRFKASAEALYIETLGSETINGIVSLGVAMLDMATKAGGLGTILKGVGLSFIALKAASLFIVEDGVIVGISSITKALFTLKGTTDVATASTLALSAAQKTLIVGAIITGVMAIGTAINHISKSAERAQQTVQTLKQELSDLQADQSAVSTLGEQYDALAQLKKESGLNNEEQREFTRIQNELKNLLPTVNGYYNDQGNFLIDASESMETFNKEMKEYLGYKKEELANAAKDVLSGNIKRYKKEAEELEKLSKYHELYNKQINEGLTNAEGDMMGDLQRDLGLPIDVIVEKLKDVKESYNDAKNSIHDNIRDIIKNTDAWGKATGEQRDAMLKFLSEVDGKKLDEFATEIRGGKEATEEFVKTLKTLPDVLNIIKDEEEEVKQSTDNMSGSYESIEENIESLVETLTDLEEMQKKNADGYSYSYKEIEELRKKYPELESAIYKTAEGWKVEQGAIDDLRGSQIELSKTHMEAQFEMQQDSLDATKTRISHITKEIEAVQSLAQARSVAAGLATKSNVSREDQSVFGAFGGTSNYEDYKNKKIAEVQKTLSSRLSKESILDIVNNNSSANNILSQSDYETLKKNQSDIIGYGKDVEALEKLKADVSKKYEEVVSGGLSGGKPAKTKKEKSPSKSDYPKYFEEGYDDAIKAVMAKGEELERAIDTTNKKISNAQIRGATEEELLLQEQLEGFLDNRKKIQEEMASTLRNMRSEIVNELSSKKLKELSGINLEGITELQLSDINRKLDVEIDKANRSKNAKLESDLSNRKSMINEYAGAIMDANNNINSLSSSWWDSENDRIEQSIALIERKYELENKLIDNRNRDIEVQMMLTKDGSVEHLALEKQKYDESLNKQNNYLKAIRELKEQGLEVDQEVIDKYINMWYDAERERINIIKTMGERAKKLKLDSLNLEQEELNNAQKATQTLVDMVIKMLKQQYAEEKALIQENSKAKEDAIKKEIDGYKKIIDAKKKSLREDKDNKDYDKELKVKQKKVSDVENKILTLANDNSKKAQAERLKLEEEKLTYIDELNEFQENRSIELQEKALDDELKRYEDAKNEELNTYKKQKDAELKKLDEHLAKEGNLRAEAIRLIENKNRDLYDKLIDWNREYGDSMDSTVRDSWNDAYDAMDTYNNGQLNVLNTLGRIADKLKEVKADIREVNDSSWQDYVDQEDIRPDKSKFPVYETEPDKKVDKTPTKEEKKYTEKEAKELIQEAQQRYLHNEAQKAKNDGNDALLRWVQNERKKWGMNSLGGHIETKGVVPNDIWEKEKKKYGFLKGGETSRTGFHWLDGSQKLPERILSPEQTQSFNKMVEYLPNVINKIESFEKTENGKSDSDIVFHIDKMVNVEGNLDDGFDMKNMKDEIMNAINQVLVNKGIKPNGIRLSSGRI